MPIRAVFFDAAGTLIRPARRVGESYALLAEKYAVHVSAPELSERFRLCFGNAPCLAFPGSTPSQLHDLERGWWKELVREIFQPWGRFDRFDDYFAELFDYFATPAAWSLYPEVAGTLGSLKQRGVIIAVISNFDSRLNKVLSGLGIAEYFDGVFVSSSVGYAKPDRRIFEAALDEHGLGPAEAAHVGDSEANDIAGAANAGLKGILIDRDGDQAIKSFSSVRSLDGILPLLFE
jgi:putative hydrolase of the HAD superfamily